MNFTVDQKLMNFEDINFNEFHCPKNLKLMNLNVKNMKLMNFTAEQKSQLNEFD